jgi:hypothetical protein
LNQNYYIETDQDPQQVIQFLEDRIYQYNSNKTSRFDGKLFSKVIRDKNDDVIAGIAGVDMGFCM